MSRRYYRILGIASSATEVDIKRAYRTLALKYHPDKCRASDAEERFKQIAEAYEVLSDPLRRSQYDRERSGVAANSNTRKNRDGVDPRKTFQRFFKGDNSFNLFFMDDDDDDVDNDDYDDDDDEADVRNKDRIFERVNEWLDPSNQKNRSTEYERTVPNHPHNYHHHNQQQQQPNNGRAKKSGRRAVKQDPPLYYDLRLTLNELFTGVTKRIKIKNRSSNVDERVFTIDVKAGWRNKTKIRFVGENDVDGKRTDVIFVVVQESHPCFERLDDDLYQTVRLSLRQALSSDEITVWTMDGKKRKIPIQNDEIISPITIKRLIGDGMPITNAPNLRGDLFIKFEIDFPLKLSKETRKKLAAILPDN